jgi:hypothetical protein
MDTVDLLLFVRSSKSSHFGQIYIYQTMQEYKQERNLYLFWLLL